MMTASAKYESEDLSVSFICQMERNDYGVSSSPSWWEPVLDTVEVDELEMLGVSVDPKALPRDLLAAILNLSDGLEWEGETE
tara:strand:+ start:274 stop:519 length:246 start_codon:yes stop_codon:yes gene_type:complete